MSLKPLINNQTVIIDDHRRGNRERKNWDDPSSDIHIDKKTNFRLNGRRQEIRIRIPLNSSRPLKIEDKSKREIKEVPGQLRREIQEAFDDKQARENFIIDVIDILRNYDTILNSEERVEQVLTTLSKHFDLKWERDKITTYKNDILELYTRNYTDQSGRHFYITVDKKKIKIAENNGYARHQQNLK